MAVLGAFVVCAVLAVAVINRVAPPRDPAVRTVAELLDARVRRSTDPADYAGLVDTTTAEGLARSATESSTADVPPTPRWKRPYLVARRSSEATVAVVWKPDPEHPDWARATLFMLTRDPSAAHGWRVDDAHALVGTETVPPKSR